MILSDQPADPSLASATYEHAAYRGGIRSDRDFLCDSSRSQRIALTKQGIRRCYEAVAGERQQCYDGPWSELVETALVALHTLKRDVDYVVSEDGLSSSTPQRADYAPTGPGAIGLAELLEAKEGVPISPARYTAARISRQRYFLLYERLTGMTGTAVESADEFWQSFQLPVETIAPRLASRRQCCRIAYLSTTIRVTRSRKTKSCEYHRSGRPVLVGTRTIERSEQIATRLDRLRMGTSYSMASNRPPRRKSLLAQDGEESARSRLTWRAAALTSSSSQA